MDTSNHCVFCYDSSLSKIFTVLRAPYGFTKLHRFFRRVETGAAADSQGLCWLKPHFHRAATFVPPLSDQKIDQDAQWSPKLRKFCSVYLLLHDPCASAEPPHCDCCSSTTGRAKEAEWRQNHCRGGSRDVVVAEWRHSGRHSDHSMDAMVGQRRHNSGTREAEASLKLIHNVYNSTHFYWAANLADPCASILRPRRCVCLPPASFERPASDLIGDVHATILNMLKTPWRLCKSESKKTLFKVDPH